MPFRAFDDATFALLARGDLEGIFQLESSGMRQIVRDLSPSSLEDILFDPGVCIGRARSDAGLITQVHQPQARPVESD